MASSSSEEKVDILKDEIFVPPSVLKVEGSTSETVELEHAKVKGARNAAFAAAVERGGTDPWSKSAFVIYACAFRSFPSLFRDLMIIYACRCWSRFHVLVR